MKRAIDKYSKRRARYNVASHWHYFYWQVLFLQASFILQKKFGCKFVASSALFARYGRPSISTYFWKNGENKFPSNNEVIDVVNGCTRQRLTLVPFEDWNFVSDDNGNATVASFRILVNRFAYYYYLRGELPFFRVKKRLCKIFGGYSRLNFLSTY